MPRYPTWRLPGFLKSGAALIALVPSPEAEAARGRAYINTAHTTFVGDNGQPLVNGWLSVRDPLAAEIATRRFLRLSVTPDP